MMVCCLYCALLLLEGVGEPCSTRLCNPEPLCRGRKTPFTLVANRVNDAYKIQPTQCLTQIRELQLLVYDRRPALRVVAESDTDCCAQSVQDLA